jgi:hypothetical protein
LFLGQISANFAALAVAVADSMPKVRLKSLKPHNFELGVQTLHIASHWKATIHIYNLQKFQKFQKFIAFVAACPKLQKVILVAIVI